MDKLESFPLTQAEEGDFIIFSLNGGKDFQHRATSMGLNIGAKLSIVKKSPMGNGPVLVARSEARLAIGYGMARKIMVKKIY
jgi:ferrous iron transport protein A